jgi:hypothetical protein
LNRSLYNGPLYNDWSAFETAILTRFVPIARGDHPRAG